MPFRPGEPVTLPGQSLPSLTGLRAAAAIAVFAYHIVFRIGGHGYEFTRNAYAGVAFFYVLSGFVLTWSFQSSIGTKTFQLRRIARIYPSHLVMALCALVFMILAGQAVEPLPSLTNLLLIQSWTNPQLVSSLNSVSWSLSDEMFFYLLLPLTLPSLMALRLRTLVALVVSWWLVMGALSVVGAGRSLELFVYVNPIVRSSEFFLGVALALGVSHGFRLRISLLPATVLVLTVYLLIVPLHVARPLADVYLDIPFAILILAAVSADRHRGRSLFRARWVVYAGEISFAFYLVHVLIMDSMVKWAPVQSPVLFAAISLGLAVVAAMALHHGVEKPCQRRLRQVEKRWRPSAETIVVSATGGSQRLDRNPLGEAGGSPR